MHKPKPGFFSDEKPLTPAKIKIKQEANKSHKTYENDLAQFPNFSAENRYEETQNKQTWSHVATPNRMTASFLGKRKILGQAKYQRLYREKSQGRSLYNRIGSSTSNNKHKKLQQKNSRIHTNQNQYHQFDVCEFFSKVQLIEQEYLQNYSNENYENAAKVLIKILNYAIDFKLPKHFLRTIRQLAEFYLAIHKTNVALFYYNQCRICAFKLNQPEILIQALIGCSLCCRKEELFEQAIIFLKKGLQCCWFFSRPEQELKIYDQFGKINYLMGDLQKASQFHEKFINATVEYEHSPQRTLSKQRMTKFLSEQQDFKICTQIDAIFLASLSIPILNFKQLPPLSDNISNARNEFNINTKYFNEFTDLHKLLKKIVQLPFFTNQMEEPQTSVLHRSTMYGKRKKFDFIDFKLKQHLKEMGIGKRQSVEIKPKNLQYRQPLDQKVKKKLRQPGLDPYWQNKMVKEIKRDRQNKLFKVQSQIRVRGKNRIVRPQIDHIRKIFLHLCY